MSVIERGFDSLGFLTDALRDALRRRLRELAGLALITASMLLSLALATWSVQDPSLSHATNAAVRNVVGVPGAIVADLLMQLFGVATIMLVLPIAIWGWRLVSHRVLSRERIRLLVWIAGVLLAAGCAACLPRAAAWPLPVGLGGVIGDWMLQLPTMIAGGTLSWLLLAAIAVVAGIATLLCFVVAAGFGWRAAEEDGVKAPGAANEEHASISLGWVVHGFLSIKARIARLLTRRAPGRGPAFTCGRHMSAPICASPAGRTEPRGSRRSSRRWTTRTRTRTIRTPPRGLPASRKPRRAQAAGRAPAMCCRRSSCSPPPRAPDAPS